MEKDILETIAFYEGFKKNPKHPIYDIKNKDDAKRMLFAIKETRAEYLLDLYDDITKEYGGLGVLNIGVKNEVTN